MIWFVMNQLVRELLTIMDKKQIRIELDELRKKYWKLVDKAGILSRKRDRVWGKRYFEPSFESTYNIHKEQQKIVDISKEIKTIEEAIKVKTAKFRGYLINQND